MVDSDKMGHISWMILNATTCTMQCLIHLPIYVQMAGYVDLSNKTAGMHKMEIGNNTGHKNLEHKLMPACTLHTPMSGTFSYSEHWQDVWESSASLSA